MKKSILLSTLGAVALAGAAEAATTATETRTIVSNGFQGAAATAQVGQSGGVNTFRAFASYRVSDLLTSEGITIAQLNGADGYTFDFSFDSGTEDELAGGTYLVGFAGFYADLGSAAASLGGGSNPNGVIRYNTLNSGTTDTGVADTLLAQTGITASGFSLSGITAGGDADFTNDYILFGIRYSAEPQAAGISEAHSNLTLTAVPVPEPSSTALLGLGGLALIMRRRK